jgi:hypothetical protein
MTGNSFEEKKIREILGLIKKKVFGLNKEESFYFAVQIDESWKGLDPLTVAMRLNEELKRNAGQFKLTLKSLTNVTAAYSEKEKKILVYFKQQTGIEAKHRAQFAPTSIGLPKIEVPDDKKK